MCGGGVHSIWFLHLVSRCLEYMVHVCFYVFCSDCVGLWESLLCSSHCVFSLGVFKMLCVRDVMDVVFSVCIVRCGAV